MQYLAKIIANNVLSPICGLMNDESISEMEKKRSSKTTIILNLIDINRVYGIENEDDAVI